MESGINLQQAFIKVAHLPATAQQQIVEYIEFMLKKHQPTQEESGAFRFDWAGSLGEEQKTAVELQHEANDLR
ncbi:MAG: DUF2281 domain-containing protein [Saprospiraceae bacterium]|nr:DUF2281 domain-containing protein [Saprospiraceae bacterium]